MHSESHIPRWFSLDFFLLHCSWLISVWSAKHEGSVARLINMRNDRASVQQGARITMHHQRTEQTKIADSQRICDGSSGRRRRRQTILFNLNAATMYRLLSIFLFYLMFTAHDVVIAADNQPDGGGNNEVNDGFTAGPEAITTAFGEFISLFGSVLFFRFSEVSKNFRVRLVEVQIEIVCDHFEAIKWAAFSTSATHFVPQRKPISCFFFSTRAVLSGETRTWMWFILKYTHATWKCFVFVCLFGQMLLKRLHSVKLDYRLNKFQLRTTECFLRSAGMLSQCYSNKQKKIERIGLKG